MINPSDNRVTTAGFLQAPGELHNGAADGFAAIDFSDSRQTAQPDLDEGRTAPADFCLGDFRVQKGSESFQIEQACVLVMTGQAQYLLFQAEKICRRVIGLQCLYICHCLAIAKKLLAREGIRIQGYVTQVGSIRAEIADPTAVTMQQVEATPIRCPDPGKAIEMIALIDAVRKDRDSIGGICEMVAVGVPPGLGEPVFDKLKADLGKAMLSLPAVTGFEYGNGFAAALLRGSENNDLYQPGFRTDTNRHGGMLGGISSGMPIVCRVAIKPTSSIPRPQRTVTQSGEATEILVKGRHDPCLLPRFVPMGEAMFALVLVDHLLRAKVAKI